MITVCLPDEDTLASVRPLPPEVTAVVWDGRDPAPNEAADIEFLVLPYHRNGWSAEVLSGLSDLRVVQLLSAGVEAWSDRLPPGVMLCSGRGIHTASAAELALAGTLALLRELPRFATAQRRGVWDHDFTDSLWGKRVLVIGAGDIGHRYAQAVEVFDATTTLVGRHARDGVHGVDELADLLGGHDIVLIAVPHTAATHHLVDGRILGALPDGALLVNIARGAVVDTDALVSELTRGRIKAFLDVTDPEPLPPGHPLWSVPNLILTPHVGGGSSQWQQRAYRLVHEQILSYAAGEPLVNVVEELQ